MTASFEWPMILSFLFVDQVEPEVEVAQNNSSVLKRNIERLINVLGDSAYAFYWLRQHFFGMELNGARLITSYYGWNESDEDVRNKAMWAHFARERELGWYDAVHFNVNLDASGDSEWDFAFEGYLADPASVGRVFSHPQLEEMRMHSSRFLDTSTRRLAVGSVEIVCSAENAQPPGDR